MNIPWCSYGWALLGDSRGVEGVKSIGKIFYGLICKSNDVFPSLLQENESQGDRRRLP